MNYEKAYNEALERAKKWYYAPNADKIPTYANRVIEEIFPELKESEDEKINETLIDYFKTYKKQEECGIKTFFGIPTDNIIAWLEKQRKKDKLIQELGKYKVKYTQEVLEKYINSMSNKDNERLRKTTIAFLKDFADKGYENAVECIDWLEKQKATDKEIIFRALPGTDIADAAKQALEKIEIGKEVVLAFNSAYIHVNGKTVAEICNEYFSWTEKQGEKKVPSIDFKAKDCYVSKVDGNIHDMTYDAADKVEPKNMEDETEIPFDANDSELTEVTYDIPKGFHAEIDDDKVVIKIGEKPTAWSEEDKNFMYDTLSNLTELKDRYGEGYGNVGKCIEWLKSLKERVQPQNNSITDEELEQAKKDAYNDALDKIEYHSGEPTFADGWHAAIDYIQKHWLEKQGEKKATDKSEYVYILDYCSGRVIVAKHDTEESIETLFDKLGLKESQCQYMVSDKILSIEYINF